MKISFLRSLARKSFSWFGGDGSLGAVSDWRPLALPPKEADASSNSVVMASVFWAMRNAGQAVPVVQCMGDSGWVTEVRHPLTELMRLPQSQIHADERSRMTGRRLLAAIVYSRMLDGNAYLLKVRNRSGRLIGLDWIPHGSIEPVAKTGSPGVIDHYVVKGKDKDSIYEPNDIIHDTDGIDPDCPVKGLSRLKSVMRHIMTDNQIAAYSQAILKNPVPSLLITAKNEGQKLTQDDADYLAGKMTEVARGDRAGSVIVPTFPADVTPIGYKPDDLTIESLNKLPEQRITAVFGIPAMVLGLGGGLDRSTYSNIKEAREAATEEFLVPLWQDIAGTLTEQLLPEFESGEVQRVWFDLSSVGTLQEDREALHRRVREDYKAGLIDRATARTQMNLTFCQGDEGKFYENGDLVTE
ncbi:phage portal protein [Kamptonema cortianum]|nr:phage portal protein [Geitlerinema splendidum]MDK3155891.1 phage portal protein [Kamptonema cortianum]